MSGGSERIVRSRGSGDTTGEAARGRAGHVELQGGSSVPIPLFPLDEVFIRPDSGDHEAPRCLEPPDDFWICLARAERPSKGPKIRPTFGMATEDRPLPFPTDRRVTRREVKDAPDLGTLETWAAHVGLTVGAVADTEAKRKKSLELCWCYTWKYHEEKDEAESERRRRWKAEGAGIRLLSWDTSSLGLRESRRELRNGVKLRP